MFSALWLILQTSDMYSRSVVLMSWNVRGMCSQARHNYIKRLMLSEKADIVLLQETKTGSMPLEIRKYECLTSTARRGSGGCMMLVNRDFKVMDMYKSDCGRILACKLCIEDECIGIVNVYASNNSQERKEA